MWEGLSLPTGEPWDFPLSSCSSPPPLEFFGSLCGILAKVGVVRLQNHACDQTLFCVEYIYVYNIYIYIYIILIARVRVQYGKIFYEHAKYFHEPKASENVA